MKVAIYSNAGSFAESWPNVSAQDLFDYVNKRNWKIVAQFEERSSGKEAEKKIRARLMSLARVKAIDVVLVKNLLSWSSSTSDLVVSLDELLQCGISFIAIEDSLELMQSYLINTNQLLTKLSLFEKKLKSFKTLNKSNGRNLAELSGNLKSKRIGRALKHRVEMINLKSQGKSHSEIARILNVSRGSVHNILGNVKKKSIVNNPVKSSEAQIYFCSSLFNIISNIKFYCKIKKNYI